MLPKTTESSFGNEGILTMNSDVKDWLERLEKALEKTVPDLLL